MLVVLVMHTAAKHGYLGNSRRCRQGPRKTNSPFYALSKRNPPKPSHSRETGMTQPTTSSRQKPGSRRTSPLSFTPAPPQSSFSSLNTAESDGLELGLQHMYYRACLPPHVLTFAMLIAVSEQKPCSRTPLPLPFTSIYVPRRNTRPVLNSYVGIPS